MENVKLTFAELVKMSSADLNKIETVKTESVNRSALLGTDCVLSYKTTPVEYQKLRKLYQDAINKINFDLRINGRKGLQVYKTSKDVTKEFIVLLPNFETSVSFNCQVKIAKIFKEYETAKKSFESMKPKK
jgi:hypothetical protein